MKKFISLLSGVALLLASASVVSVAAEGDETPAATPARPAANGDVAWAADFRAENQENWVVGSNWKTDGSTEGNLAVGPRHLIKEPTGISEDGLSVTLQAGADDLVPMTCFKIEDIDLNTYNTLYFKGTWNKSSKPDDNGHLMLKVHDGLHYNGAAQPMDDQDPPQAIPVKEVPITPPFTDENNFITIDLSSLKGEAATTDIWVQLGFHLDKEATLDIEYMFIGTKDCADNATKAKTIVDNYVAGNPKYVEPVEWASDEYVFDAATDTKENLVNGAMLIGLKISDVKKMQEADNMVILSDGTNNLNWNLADYTMQEGKINYMLLPFYEARNSVSEYSNAATRLDLTKVTKVIAKAENYEGELDIEIVDVDFVNFNDLLKTIGIVFYDSASVNSVVNTPVETLDGLRAYKLSGDGIHSAEYKNGNPQVDPIYQRFTTENPMDFGNVLANNLDVYMNVKIEGKFNNVNFQFCSEDSGAYPTNQMNLGIKYDDLADSIKNNKDWQVLTSAKAGQFVRTGDGAVNVNNIQMMRLLLFRNDPPVEGAVYVDYVMLVDSTKYTGDVENLYLYAVSDMDGKNMVNLFTGEEGGKPNPPTGEHAVALLVLGTVAASAGILIGTRKKSKK